MTILVAGAFHHDVIVESPRLPALDETLAGHAVRYAVGGKGVNQALAAARFARNLEIPIAFTGCLGRDAAAEAALQDMARLDVDCSTVQRSDKPSGMSVAISLPNGEYGAVIVSSANLDLRASKIRLPADLRWLVLQNEIDTGANRALAQRAKDQGAGVLFNAAPARDLEDRMLDLVDILVVNRVEAAQLASVQADKTATLAQSLAEKFQTTCIVTLGGDGLIVADPKSDLTTIAAHRVDVHSTHGAGDVFTGALAASLAAGEGLLHAARFANQAAGLHVGLPTSRRADLSAASVLDSY